MKRVIEIISFVLLIANLALAVYSVIIPSIDFKSWMTLLSTINAVAIAFVGIWGIRKAKAHERLIEHIIGDCSQILSAEIETAFLLHRFKQEDPHHLPYELPSTFVEDGKFHEVLRTARLIVSLHRDKSGERVERGRLRAGDQVDITPIGSALFDKEMIESLGVKTRDDRDWASLRQKTWETSRSVLDELNKLASSTEPPHALESADGSCSN